MLVVKINENITFPLPTAMPTHYERDRLRRNYRHLKLLNFTINAQEPVDFQLVIFNVFNYSIIFMWEIEWFWHFQSNLKNKSYLKILTWWRLVMKSSSFWSMWTRAAASCSLLRRGVDWPEVRPLGPSWNTVGGRRDVSAGSSWRINSHSSLSV